MKNPAAIRSISGPIAEHVAQPPPAVSDVAQALLPVLGQWTPMYRVPHLFL
jgi:hypothetical protein